MVLLDENHVVEAAPVVHRATGARRRPFELAPERGRLPGIRNPRARSLDRRHKAARQSRHARQLPEEIQGRALSSQDRAP